MVTLTRSPQVDKAGKGSGAPADRRTLIVLVGLLLVIGLAGIGYLLLSAFDDGVATDTSPPARRSAISGVTGSSSPSGGATASPSASSGHVAAAPGDRNPFAGSGPAGAAPTTTPATSTNASTAPTATSQPTSAPGVTTVVTTTRTATLTSTRTVTVPATSVYLGLYGWTDDGRPMFRVNEAPSTPTAGTTFATNLVYVGSSVDATRTCAIVTYAGAANSICAGEVLKLS